LVEVLSGGGLLSDTDEGPVDSCNKVPGVVTDVDDGTSQGIDGPDDVGADPTESGETNIHEVSGGVEKLTEQSLESPIIAPRHVVVLALRNDNGTAVYGNSKNVHAKI
jgi:hypothetical protein